MWEAAASRWAAPGSPTPPSERAAAAGGGRCRRISCCRLFGTCDMCKASAVLLHPSACRWLLPLLARVFPNASAKLKGEQQTFVGEAMLGMKDVSTALAARTAASMQGRRAEGCRVSSGMLVAGIEDDSC